MVTGALAITSDGASLLIEVGAVLIVLALLARLAARTAFSPIPLYLLAGLAIGAVAPRDLDAAAVDIGTQIAVILLLFMLGLEYSIDDVVSSLQSGLFAGLVDAVLNFTPGLVAGLLLGWDWLPSVVLGGVTYISSSSIIAKVLDDLGRLGNSETPAMLGVLVLEDLVMAPYLPFVAVLLAGDGLPLAATAAVGAAGLAFVALLFARRHGPRLSRRLSHPKSEVVLLSVVGLLLIAGGVAELAHVSGGIVAFLVGLSVSGSIAQRARELLSPLRDLFAALFFVTFGYVVEVGQIPDVLLMAVVLWAVTAATKVATGWVAARGASGVPGRVRAGTALVARGEFSIVIAGLAAASGAEPRLAALAATYVLFTAVSGPLLTRYADTITHRLRRAPAGPPRAAACRLPQPSARRGAPSERGRPNQRQTPKRPRGRPSGACAGRGSSAGDDSDDLGRRRRDARRAGLQKARRLVPSPGDPERHGSGGTRLAHVAGRVAHEPHGLLPRMRGGQHADLLDLAGRRLGSRDLGHAGHPVDLEPVCDHRLGVRGHDDDAVRRAERGERLGDAGERRHGPRLRGT